VASEPLAPDGIQIEEPSTLVPETGIEKVEIEGLARTQYEGSGLFKVDQVEPEPPSEPGEASEALEERTTSPITDLPLILPEDVEPPAPRAFGGAARSRRRHAAPARRPAPAAGTAPRRRWGGGCRDVVAGRAGGD
jgi:hypothetical protein